MRRSFFAAAFMVVLAMAPTPFAADADADALIKEGVELRKMGKDGEALAKFSAAWEASHTPKARAQMALAEQALGRWVDAYKHIEEALASASDAWITQHKKSLEDAQTEIGKHVGRLEVTGDVGGTELLLNGTSIGTLPLEKPVLVEIGTWTLEARRAGYYTVSKSVVITAGVLARATVDMKPLPVEAPPTPPPNPAKELPPPKPSVVPPPALPKPSVDEGPGTTRRTLSYVGLGLAAVSLGIGGYALGRRNSESSAYNDDKSCPGTESLTQPPACDTRIRHVHDWQTVSLIGFVTGGVVATGSIVLLVTAPSPKSASAGATRFYCGMGPGTVGIGCTVIH